MSEIARLYSQGARQRLAEEGSPGAGSALALAEQPSRFLSTVQVGITLIGILSGAIGETALADSLTDWLMLRSPFEEYAGSVSLTIVVIGITYFTVVVGELVPSASGCRSRGNCFDHGAADERAVVKCLSTGVVVIFFVRPARAHARRAAKQRAAGHR